MDFKLLRDKYLDSKRRLAALEMLCSNDIKLNGLGIRVLGIHYMDNGQGWRALKHRHTFFEYHLVVEGYVHTVLDGVEHKVEAGTGYLIPPAMYHSHKQKNGSEHIGFALRWEFTNETMETQDLNDALMSASGELIACSKRICRIIDELLESTEASAVEGQLMLLQLILNLGPKNGGGGQSCESTSKKDYGSKVASQAIRFIEENYMEDLHVEDVASSVFISYSQLARIFKKHVGVTVNQYLSDYRIDKAKRLLKHSDKEIRSVAGETGFNSEYYFSNAFKSCVGMAPSAYRESNRT